MLPPHFQNFLPAWVLPAPNFLPAYCGASPLPCSLSSKATLSSGFVYWNSFRKDARVWVSRGWASQVSLSWVWASLTLPSSFLNTEWSSALARAVRAYSRTEMQEDLENRVNCPIQTDTTGRSLEFRSGDKKFNRTKNNHTHIPLNANSGLWPLTLGSRATSPAASPYPYTKSHKLELVPAPNVSLCPTNQRPLRVKDLIKHEFNTATLEGKARTRDTGSHCKTRRDHLHRKQRPFQAGLSGISILNHNRILSPRENSGEEARKLWVLWALRTPGNQTQSSKIYFSDLKQQSETDVLVQLWK